MNNLHALAGVGSLLSSHNSNPKVAKAEAKLGIRIAVLHLAPADLSGYEVCPSRSAGCSAACLHYAGHRQSVKDKARIARTKFFFENRDQFMLVLEKEIAAHIRAARRAGMPAAVRLNGTSDMAWERIRGPNGTILNRFPDVQFYDYTAVINRLRRPLPENYHLTFSLKEDNLDHSLEALNLGFNVAAVFENELPSTYLNLPVIDGDEHDYRPSDPTPCIVGLKVKGAKGRADQTGFIHRDLPMLQAA